MELEEECAMQYIYMLKRTINICRIIIKMLNHANNLYGWAMSKKLPVGELELINPENYTEEIIKKYDEKIIRSNTHRLSKETS